MLIWELDRLQRRFGKRLSRNLTSKTVFGFSLEISLVATSCDRKCVSKHSLISRPARNTPLDLNLCSLRYSIGIKTQSLLVSRKSAQQSSLITKHATSFTQLWKILASTQSLTHSRSPGPRDRVLVPSRAGILVGAGFGLNDRWGSLDEQGPITLKACNGGIGHNKNCDPVHSNMRSLGPSLKLEDIRRSIQILLEDKAANLCDASL